MNSNKYVFVSYSQKDRGFVEKLIDDLRFSGINTWYDVAHIQRKTFPSMIARKQY